MNAASHTLQLNRRRTTLARGYQRAEVVVSASEGILVQVHLLP